jgi:general secretion pathway protein K
MTRPRDSERGAALLTVLMLVAVIAALAAASLEKLRLATRLTGNLAAIEQARAYGLAGEAIAASRITDLLARDASRTTLAGGWLGTPRPFPIDNGSASVTVSDGGNCFNLNSLVEGNAEAGYTARASGVAQFEGLMLALDVPRNDARRIALAAADWIDTDTFALPGGAEDQAYRDFRTANTLMADASEVRVVTGMTAGAYARIRPWLCALPAADLSPINVNTLAPDQAPLVAMLLPGQLDIEGARRVILSRPRDGFPSMVEFWRMPALSGFTPSPEILAQPKLKTSWFQLDIDIDLAGAEFDQTSLIDARENPVRAVRRVFGDPA